MGAGPAKATIKSQDACRSKTQINYKNKGFGRSGWFSKPLNYFIKIDLSRVHYLEKCLFSRISAFLDRPCSAERRVLKLQNARNKAFLVILCRIGCRFARQAYARHTLGGRPKSVIFKAFWRFDVVRAEVFLEGSPGALWRFPGALWRSLGLSGALRASQRLPHKGCPTKAAPQRLPHKGCLTKAAPQRLPHKGCSTKAAPQRLPHKGCLTKAAPQRLPHKGCSTKAAPQRLP